MSSTLILCSILFLFFRCGFLTNSRPFRCLSYFAISFCRMEAVYAWCKGVKFVEVQKLTGTFEGSTIRALRRLEELVRQLASASKAIGNLELQAKFEKGSELLKRDIVFCSSLYL